MKKLGIIMGIILTLIVSFMLASHFLVTTNIKLAETYIKDERIPSSFDGARIIQFSDTLIHNESDLNLLQKVVKKINKTHPDIVVFTGDLFSSDNVAKELSTQTQAILSEIEASIMKIAVLGDHDVLYHEELVTQTFTSSNFTVLRNEILQVYNGSSDVLTFVGLDSLQQTQNYQSLITQVNDSTFNFLLLHEPNLASLMTDEAIDVQLSGHCLGTNQIRQTDDKNTVNYCEQFYNGTYPFVDQLLLYVSDGVNSSMTYTHPLKRPSIHSFLLLKP
ncbi:MAG TPA: hypothetical protein DCY20_03540 [Firmicutes bacterium]|nr:hypothetical protein [Bacillota bacterium]